jgi:hypothetical protein
MNKYSPTEKGNKLDPSDGQEFDLNDPRNEEPTFYKDSLNSRFDLNNESLIQEWL